MADEDFQGDNLSLGEEEEEEEEENEDEIEENENEDDETISRNRNPRRARGILSVGSDGPAADRDREEEFLDRLGGAIEPIRDEAFRSRPHGRGQHMSKVEKIVDITKRCIDLPSELVTQVQSDVANREAQAERPRRRSHRPSTTQDIIDRLPTPGEAFSALGGPMQAALKARMATDNRWTDVRDKVVGKRGAGANTAFWAMWSAVCAAGSCPSEIISRRTYLQYSGSGKTQVEWSSTFCNHLKHLVLGSPCNDNYGLLACFIRLTAASRIDDHRAIPLGDHGLAAGSFFATFATRMAANTSGGSIKAVYGATKTAWSPAALPWESQVISKICAIDWREPNPSARGLSGQVSLPYEVTVSHVGRLIKVFDDSVGPKGTHLAPAVETRAKASAFLDKKHYAPNNMQDLNRIREQSFLLDLCFEEQQRNPPPAIVPTAAAPASAPVLTDEVETGQGGVTTVGATFQQLHRELFASIGKATDQRELCDIIVKLGAAAMRDLQDGRLEDAVPPADGREGTDADRGHLDFMDDDDDDDDSFDLRSANENIIEEASASSQKRPAGVTMGTEEPKRRKLGPTLETSNVSKPDATRQAGNAGEFTIGAPKDLTVPAAGAARAVPTAEGAESRRVARISRAMGLGCDSSVNSIPGEVTASSTI